MGRHPRPACGVLLVLVLLACLAPETSAQEDAQAAPAACYGAGSVATAVVLTFLLTALLFVAGSVWWRKYRTKTVPDHLILETDPEKGKGVYAFDNPGFKDASYLATTKHPLETEDKSLTSKSKWHHQWTPLSAFTVKSERGKALDDSAIEGNEVKVISLKSHDFTGLGFNICGNMKEGIFVKDVLQRGPASESGKLSTGDRIHSVSINFEHMVYEDALTILGYASPYEVTIEASSGKWASSPPDQGGQPTHPVYRSSSWSDLYRVGKSSKRLLFGDDLNASSSTYSSLQKSRSNMTTLERKESKSPRPKQPRTKQPSGKHFSPERLKTQLEQKVALDDSNNMSDPEPVRKIDNKHQKFGVRVLPLEIQQKSPKIMEQNENNINIERNQLNLSVTSIDEVDDPKKPPPVKRREKKQSDALDKTDNFDRSSLNGSGIKRTKEGIPLELPLHMLNAASAALRNRDDVSQNKRKGRAPAVPEDIRSLDEEPAEDATYNSDSDAEDNHSSVNTIELNPTDITIHQTEDEQQQLQNRKTLSAGDLSHIRRQKSPIGTLERAQSLDISDSKPDEALHREPRLSLILDGLSTFERNRLKKSSEWGDLEDAIRRAGEEEPERAFDAVISKADELRRESRAEEPTIKNQIWPSFDGQLNGMPREKPPTRPQEEPVRKPSPLREKPPPPARKPVNNRIDEPFEAAENLARSVISLEVAEENGRDSLVEDKTGLNDRETVPLDGRKTASSDSETISVEPHQAETINDSATSYSSLEFSVGENKTASNVPETVTRVSPEPTILTNDLVKSATASEIDLVEYELASKSLDSVNVASNTVENGTENVNEVRLTNSQPGDHDKFEVMDETKNTTRTKSYASFEIPVNELRKSSNGLEPVNIVLHQNNRESHPDVEIPYDGAKSNESLEFSPAEDQPASNDLEIGTKTKTHTFFEIPHNAHSVNVKSQGNSRENTFTKSYKLEFPAGEDKTENVNESNRTTTASLDDCAKVEPRTKSYTSFEIPITAKSSNGFDSVPPKNTRENTFTKSSTVELPAVEDDDVSIEPDSRSQQNIATTKSYTSFEIPINEASKVPDRTSRRQRVPAEDVTQLPRAEPPVAVSSTRVVLSKIPLLNSMVENQRKQQGNITDETKTVVTLNAAVPDVLDLTQNFLYTEQLNSSYAYGGGSLTNVPDDVKVSRHDFVKVKESSRHVSNVNVSEASNGDGELHSLEFSVNGDTDTVTIDSSSRFATALEERSSTPTYITEIQVTAPSSKRRSEEPESREEPKKLDSPEENELEKIKEIAERQLKKLPEMRFTTSSYDAPRRVSLSTDKRHSSIEHLRSNFEKPPPTPPKLTRQESASKSRIPIATAAAKTPPTSPERRDSHNLDQEKAILELMTARYQQAKTPTPPPPKNVTVTSIRSGSKIPSGLPTLGGGRSPPRRADSRRSSDGGADSTFKQWVFDPSNVTNVVVDDKRE